METFLPYNIETLFLLFMTYSFGGWLMETTIKTVEMKKFVNRGFLIGPYCPIYGYGTIIMTCFLERFSDHLVLLFIMSTLVCSILEYLTSFVMEKLFHSRWWDYTTQLFNLNGRICLSNCILFGIGGVLVIKIGNPILLDLFKLIPYLDIIALILFIIFACDTILSTIIIGNISHAANVELKDSTIEISEKVRAVTKDLHQEVVRGTGDTLNLVTGIIMDIPKEVTNRIKNTITKRSYLYRRIVEAYPNFQIRFSWPKRIQRKIINILQDRKIIKK